MRFALAIYYHEENRLTLDSFPDRESAYLFLMFYGRDRDLWLDEASTRFESVVRCGHFDIADVIAASNLDLEWKCLTINLTNETT